MPPKKKNDGAVDATLPEIPAELLDQFVTGPMMAESVEVLVGQPMRWGGNVERKTKTA
jgi:hypothetical protein